MQLKPFDLKCLLCNFISRGSIK